MLFRSMLDDSLQQTRHDLETAREQLARLEVQVREHEELVSKGLLVEKVVYDKMEKQMASELQEERKRRAQAESAKRKTDSEVEALTAALFEEANVVCWLILLLEEKGKRNRSETDWPRWLLQRAKTPKPPTGVASNWRSSWGTRPCYRIPCRSNYKI